MINSINPVDSIVIQTSNNRQSENHNPDKMIKQNSNVVELNLSISEDELIRAVENVNKDHMVEQERLEYEYHEDTGKYVIRIVDTKTREVVKQIPEQKLLDYAAGLMEYIGMRFDITV
jgi:flagellar protein FlaG